MEDFYQKLKNKLNNASKIVFLGIGEEKLSDDGVGPYIIGELLRYSSDRSLFLNAGTDPMARIDDVLRFYPSHLVLIDTCNLRKEPGTVTLLDRKDLYEYVPISSHTIPIHIVIDLIVQKVPNIIIFMIGFVPESLNGFKELNLDKRRQESLLEHEENIELPFFQIKLTRTVNKAADLVINAIKRIINNLD